MIFMRTSFVVALLLLVGAACRTPAGETRGSSTTTTSSATATAPAMTSAAPWLASPCAPNDKAPLLDIYFDVAVTTQSDAGAARVHATIRIPPLLPIYEVLDEVWLAPPSKVPSSAHACTTEIESNGDTMTFDCTNPVAAAPRAVGAISVHGGVLTIQLHSGGLAGRDPDARDDTRTIDVPCGTRPRFHVP
jgi:hypothetical protein